MRLLMVAHIPPGDVAEFTRYEDAVLPLLAEHGARLTRRLRSADGCVEVHELDFPSQAALDAYRRDPRRLALHMPTEVRTDLFELT